MVSKVLSVRKMNEKFKEMIISLRKENIELKE
jgi:hypothetical protein